MVSICLQEHQTGTQMATEACGFTTIVIGTFLLHATRELDVSLGEHSLPWLEKLLPHYSIPMPVFRGLSSALLLDQQAGSMSSVWQWTSYFHWSHNFKV